MNAIDVIKETVSIYDLCDEIGTSYSSRTSGGKIFCPFHDDTRTKSAYLYPDTNSMFCFVCNRAWDPISFWAEANEWRKPDGKLNYGAAIQDLLKKYDIEITEESWEQKARALLHTPEKDATDKDLTEDYYGWMLSKQLKHFDKEKRAEKVDDVLDTWDQLDEFDDTSITWKSDLIQWFRKANIRINT